MKKKIGIIQHGCAKNLVDTELMIGFLMKSGYEITLNPEDEDVKTVIINTCSFIHDAEKESVQSILKMAQSNKRIIVTGCLPQKHREELKTAIPEIEAMLGTVDFDKIVEAIENKNYVKISENPSYNYPEEIERGQITVGSSSYIKIADGCNFSCGYCIIPKLRGKYRSRKMEDIIKEAKMLADKGVGEIILIAQDTTSYGIDLYKKPSLAKLLEELNKIKNLNWIRVLYTYPTNFDDELINAFRNLDKVVKYIDIPLQHSHPEVLKRMNRPVTYCGGDYVETSERSKNEVFNSRASETKVCSPYEKLISKIRKNIPGIALRTTFIVGYPGETDEQFEHLKNFIQKIEFDRLGVFEFSREKGTIADKLKPQISGKIKKARRNELLEIQKKISNDINKKLIGKKIACIIEEVNENGLTLARSYKDAPEVDGIVYIKTNKHLIPCEIEMVKITGHNDYDLYGEV